MLCQQVTLGHQGDGTLFLVFDHIDTLIAADYYEENNQPLLSEAMKLLNRPPLEIIRVNLYKISFTRCNFSTYGLTKSWTKSRTGYNTSSTRSKINIPRTGSWAGSNNGYHRKSVK